MIPKLSPKLYILGNVSGKLFVHPKPIVSTAVSGAPKQIISATVLEAPKLIVPAPVAGAPKTGAETIGFGRPETERALIVGSTQDDRRVIARRRQSYQPIYDILSVLIKFQSNSVR